jgi:hypothetical protein
MGNTGRWAKVEDATVLELQPEVTEAVTSRKGIIGVYNRQHFFVEIGPDGKERMVIRMSLKEYSCLMTMGMVALMPKRVSYVIILPQEIGETAGGTGLVG